MSDPYERVAGGRLAFKGGILAKRSKGIDKKKKKKKKPVEEAAAVEEAAVENAEAGGAGGAKPPGAEIYTIDAAKKMKYEELFPVETKKFGYSEKKDFNSVEDALDDRVKKKADRYCK